MPDLDAAAVADSDLPLAWFRFLWWRVLQIMALFPRLAGMRKTCSERIVGSTDFYG